VNHSTVLRRIAQLEERLGVHMFEKLPSGYRLTAAGEEVLEFADQMEASSHLLETRVFGRDQSVRGLLRVTLTPPLANHLLMPDFADFARLHPDIEMEILSSGDLANLTNREADVAIRVVYDRKSLPLNLHGLKGPELFGGVYMSRDRLAAWRGTRHRPAHVRNGLASHTGGDTQDEARAALHRVRIPQARRVRSASRGTVRIARLTRGRSSSGRRSRLTAR
jgi:DNA-binding transcriptional LysR family regulator